MCTRRRELLLNLLKLFDLSLMVGCFLLASLYTVRAASTLSVTDFFSMRIKLMNFILFSSWLLLWYGILSLFRLYDSRRLFGYRQDCIDTSKATTLATLLLAVVAFLLHIGMISAIFLLVFWLLLTASLMASRLALRYTLHRVRLFGRNLRNLLIVGTNPRALRFAQMIESRPELGYRVVGFVDRMWEGLEGFRRSRYQVVCDLEDVASYLRTSVVDEIIIALPLRSMHTAAATIVRLCEEQGITTGVLPNIFDLKLARVRADSIDEAALITNYMGAADGWPAVLKRTLDIILSAILLVGLSPVLLIAAVLIKITSTGPVVFVQYRMGLNKRKFKMCKLRTMVMNAEEQIRELEHLNEVSGPVFKIKDDPRITAVGKILRKASIDELPQLFNVLKGDMSLVGPRPLPVRDYNGFSQDWQRRRFTVRPGITCLWQVNGRNAIPFDKWMELDLQYIDKWSLWLDFTILLRTIPAVFRGYGAA